MVIQNVGGFLFGARDGLLYALVVFTVLDYITGVCVAIYNKHVSSTIGAKGIAKKVMMFAIVSFSHIIDEHLMSTGTLLRSVTIVFYLSNECISIFENAGRIGLPLPEKLKEVIQYFEKLKKR